jgi:hypothetical protein
MKFKLIVVILEDKLTDRAIEVARVNGATGCTVITSARGEGLKPVKTFLGLSVTGQRDVVLMLVEEHGSRRILEAVGAACRFDFDPGVGVAIQIDIEDAIGLEAQMRAIRQDISMEDL